MCIDAVNKLNEKVTTFLSIYALKILFKIYLFWDLKLNLSSRVLDFST